MKFLLTLSLLVLAIVVNAETPESIHPKTKVIKPLDWYAHQAVLWQEKASQSPKDGKAWLNLFLAKKYSLAQRGELVALAGAIHVAIPNSFEDKFVRSITAPLTKESFDNLKSAYLMQPHNAITYADLMLMNEFLADATARKEFSEKLFHTGMVSSSLLNYSYNVLMSLEENAVLITDSDNTTIPLLMLQDVLKVRNDVKVLDLDLVEEAEYRRTKLAGIGLKLQGDESSSRQELCALLPEQNPAINFYYALTLSKDNILSIKDQLYVVGLASQLSTKRIDNISAIKSNLENRFLLDYLTVDFNGEGEYAAGKILSANYLVPMLLLLDHYRVMNETEKAATLEGQIMKIASQSGKTSLVENFLNRTSADAEPFIPVKIEAKSLEGMMKPVKDNVYAHEYEVTNLQYNQFLDFLLKNNKTALYEICKIHLEQYEEPALSFMKSYHLVRTPTKKEKYFNNYPIVNISYEAAQAYCTWLTEQYNNTAERKFRRVKFRLPSIKEWQVAALGYRKIQSWNLNENTIEMQIPKDSADMICKGCEKKSFSFPESDIRYPWFGAYYYRNKALNSKGCALGNFKWPESVKPCLPKMPIMDGWILMAPVQSYFPNDIGLYDVVGNVAEMTNEKGKACGGSWNHLPEESTILSVNEYSGPSSEVGFRIFMEVLEP